MRPLHAPPSPHPRRSLSRGGNLHSLSGTDYKLEWGITESESVKVDEYLIGGRSYMGLYNKYEYLRQ